MPSSPDEGRLNSIKLQSGLTLYKGNSPVFFFERFDYSFSVVILLFFHRRFSLVTCQDSQTVSSFCRTQSHFYRLWITFFFSLFICGVFATEKLTVPFWPPHLWNRISAGQWVGLENSHCRLFGLIICVSLRLSWFRTGD